MWFKGARWTTGANSEVVEILRQGPYADDPVEVQRWMTLAAEAGQPTAQEVVRQLHGLQ